MPVQAKNILRLIRQTLGNLIKIFRRGNCQGDPDRHYYVSFKAQKDDEQLYRSSECFSLDGFDSDESDDIKLFSIINSQTRIPF
ncbi:Hypothetical predicted protein [Drosophila guanche]|uniref:Uncharacterized protein n=1 Tax=Drosophila guanche TaxID=7266 RepID=A0A3B0J7R2_DROGU|nr:Hypothetical predicted protein [Drosophila guanche]